MSTFVGTGARQDPTAEKADRVVGCLVAAGLIGFGLWLGAHKSIEFFTSSTENREVVEQAEMEYLHRRMDCLPGEVLVIIPLGDKGAKSVKCVPGSNMPRPQRQLDGGTRG